MYGFERRRGSVEVLAYGFPRLMRSDILVSMISEIRNADSYVFKSLIRESHLLDDLRSSGYAFYDS